MDLQSIKLDHENYEKFLTGAHVAIDADASLINRVRTGDELLVMRDSTANHTTAGTPTREKQSDYIGINATVLEVERRPDGSKITFQKR